MITWKYMIMYKILALDMNTLNHTGARKLFVLKRNTLYQIYKKNNKLLSNN